MRAKKHYYGFEYWGGRHTSTGTPNTDPGPYRDRLSVAGDAELFFSRKERDAWVEDAPAGVLRDAVTKQELRKLLCGIPKRNFRDYLDSLYLK